jgi:hypothetical protein
MQGITDDLDKLDEQGRQLHSAMGEESVADREWELAFAQKILTVEGSSKEKREAAALVAIQAEDPDLYIRHYTKPLEVERLKTLSRLTMSRLSARQSMLSALKAEAFSNEGDDRLAWSGRRG